MIRSRTETVAPRMSGELKQYRQSFEPYSPMRVLECGDIFPSGKHFFFCRPIPTDSDILLFFGYFSRNMRCINISFHNKKNNNSEHCYSLISLSLCLCVCVPLHLSLSLSLSLYDTHFNSSTFNKAMRTNNPFCAWRKYALLLSPSTAGSISSTLGKGCITQAVSDKASITD